MKVGDQLEMEDIPDNNYNNSVMLPPQPAVGGGNVKIV